jgi:hypothetical protein
MDENLKSYIKKQYIANVSIGLGLIAMFSGVSFLGLAGSIFVVFGIGIRLYQKFFQKELHSKDNALKKSVREEKIAEKANISKSERELKKIRLILMCMSAAMGLFILSLALTYFGV